jgi:hypothetical protein
MAGVITHMVIAREMLKLLPENTIEDQALFYLGTLAPDAIHAREGFIRAEKKHTHLRDDIPDKDFAEEKNIKLFYQRVSTFILDNRDRTDGLVDLYRGYITHVLTDELFVLTIRKEFCDRMEELGIEQKDRRFFDYIVTDMNRNDLLLIQNYEEIDEIIHLMEQVPAYEVKGYLSEKEMRESRDWLLQIHFMKNQEILQPVYITYDRMQNFIKLAAEDIVKRLSDDVSFPKMW